eukprot:gene1923-2180_t
MKKAKDRITVNACANATGDIKVPLLFIGKAKNPRCFKGINQSTLPVIYCHQPNASVDTDIFSWWFHKQFVPFVRAKLSDMGPEEKAILFLDNCAAHPGTEDLISKDGKITARFFPPNVTALIQPMDQCVLESMRKGHHWFENDGPGYEHLDDERIIGYVSRPDDAAMEDEDDDEIEMVEPECPVTNQMAMDAFETCLTWVRFQSEATAVNTTMLLQLHELAAEKRENGRKQTRIESFFQNK